MSDALNPPGHDKAIRLYQGIELSYNEFVEDSLYVEHKPCDHIIEINYCRAGRIIWKMGDGNLIYLNPGDFFVQIKRTFTKSMLTFPTGRYEGLTITIDLPEASANPPEPLKETEVFAGSMMERFYRNEVPVFLAGNEETERIFSAFYGQPEWLQTGYQKIKVLELFLYLSRIELTAKNLLTEYRYEQMETVRRVHDELIEHMERRVTIEEISRKYLINPTTLKAVFKDIYGSSIAAHIKAHRMEHAAELLRETDKSLAEIAQAVGYDSQSKFTAAFKNFYQVLPKEYRRKTL